jgi:hypothetical protein
VLAFQILVRELTMKNVRVKACEGCSGDWWDYGIFEGRSRLMGIVPHSKLWQTKEAAIRNAKAMAKRIGISFDPEIIKQHGC